MAFPVSERLLPAIPNCRERLIDSLAAGGEGGEGFVISFTLVPMLYQYLCAHPVDPWWRGVCCTYLAFLHGLFVTCRVLLPRFSTFSLSFHHGHANSPRELIHACEKFPGFIIAWKYRGRRGDERTLGTGNERNTTAQLVTHGVCHFSGGQFLKKSKKSHGYR